MPKIQTSTAPTADATGGLIPYQNPFALVAYYLGVFSLIPFLGLVLAIPAIVFGILGLRHKRRQPQIKGTAHAWIGIVMGSLFTLLWGGLIVAMIVWVVIEI